MGAVVSACVCVCDVLGSAMDCSRHEQAGRLESRRLAAPRHRDACLMLGRSETLRRVSGKGARSLGGSPKLDPDRAPRAWTSAPPAPLDAARRRSWSRGSRAWLVRGPRQSAPPRPMVPVAPILFQIRFVGGRFRARSSGLLGRHSLELLQSCPRQTPPRASCHASASLGSRLARGRWVAPRCGALRVQGHRVRGQPARGVRRPPGGRLRHLAQRQRGGRGELRVRGHRLSSQQAPLVGTPCSAGLVSHSGSEFVDFSPSSRGSPRPEASWPLVALVVQPLRRAFEPCAPPTRPGRLDTPQNQIHRAASCKWHRFSPEGVWCLLADGGCGRCGVAGVASTRPRRTLGRARADVPSVGRQHAPSISTK